MHSAKSVTSKCQRFTVGQTSAPVAADPLSEGAPRGWDARGPRAARRSPGAPAHPRPVRGASAFKDREENRSGEGALLGRPRDGDAAPQRYRTARCPHGSPFATGSAERGGTPRSSAPAHTRRPHRPAPPRTTRSGTDGRGLGSPRRGAAGGAGPGWGRTPPNRTAPHRSGWVGPGGAAQLGGRTIPLSARRHGNPPARRGRSSGPVNPRRYRRRYRRSARPPPPRRPAPRAAAPGAAAPRPPPRDPHRRPPRVPPPPPLSPPPRCGPRGAVGAHSPSGAAARLGHPGGGGGCSAPRAALSPARPRTGSARREHGGGGRGRGRRRCTPSLPPAVPSGPGSRTVPERSGRRDRARRHRHPRYGTAAPRVLQHPWAAPQRLGAPPQCPPHPPRPEPCGARTALTHRGSPWACCPIAKGAAPAPPTSRGGSISSLLESSLSASALGPGTAPLPPPRGRRRAPGSADTARRELCSVTVPPAAPISLLFLLSTGLLRATHSLQQQPRFPQPTAGHLAASFCLMGLQQSLEAGHGFGSRWVRLPSPQLSAIARAASATVSAHREGHAIASRHLCVFGAAGAAARTWHRLCRAGCRAPFWMLVLSAGLYGSSPACHCHVHSAGRSK